MKYRATIAVWFSHFFENAFVRRVNRRIDICMVRFWRSTSLVEMCFGQHFPVRLGPNRCDLRVDRHISTQSVHLGCLFAWQNVFGVTYGKIVRCQRLDRTLRV